jgi:hypothetical protein
VSPNYNMKKISHQLGDRERGVINYFKTRGINEAQ